MPQPFRHGAFLRAVIAFACLFLVAAFAFAPRAAHAEGRHFHHHHRHHHAGHRHDRHTGLARHHKRAVVAIDMHSGAIEPASPDPFAFVGSLFRPPAPALLTIDHRFIRPAIEAVQRVGRMASAGYAAVARHAREIGVPLPLALAEAKQESGGNCRAHSYTNARGVLQVEPYTAEKDGFDPGRLYDCDYGAIAGLTELKKLLDADGGITCHAVSRYYGSDAYLSRFRDGCAPYGRQVLARMRAIEREPEASIMLAEWPEPLRHYHHHHLRA